jgi:aspartate carbamoyltransferase catalytic subunit
MPAHADRWGASVHFTMREGLAGADVVMMLRLQTERMQGGFFPSAREFHWFYGLDEEKLRYAKPGALVMHPGPMNRGVEIDSRVADDSAVSLIEHQVRMGVALRMAVLEALAAHGANA